MPHQPVALHIHTPAKLTAKDTIVLADFDEQDGRSGFRRHAATGTVGTASTVSVPQPDFGPAGPADAAADGTAEGARLTPEIWLSRSASEPEAPRSGRLDRRWKSICVGLRARNCNTGPSSIENRTVQRKRKDVLIALSRNRPQISEPEWANRSLRGKAFDAACRGYDTVTRSPQGLQHRNKGELIRWHCGGPYLSSAVL